MRLYTQVGTGGRERERRGRKEEGRGKSVREKGGRGKER